MQNRQALLSAGIAAVSARKKKSVTLTSDLGIQQACTGCQDTHSCKISSS